MSSSPAAADAPAPPPFVPCVHLRTESLVLSGGAAGGAGFREVELPVIELSFDYGGGRRFAAADDRTGVELRDRDRERQARYVLEGFGAVDLSCLDDHAAGPGSTADYLVRVDDDIHDLCTFSGYAVPQLRALGWRVDVAADYPIPPVAPDVPWYAHVDESPGAAGSGGDWFNLELGIELDGRRVNLLPALLDLLEHLPRAGSLDSLAPRDGACFALPIGDGRYLPIPGERLRILVGVLRELYDPDAPRGFPAARAACLAALDGAFGSSETPPLRWEGATGVRDRGHALASGPAASPRAPADTPPPSGLQATLRPYQREGLAWLQHLRAHDAAGVLADDMGLGKTLQTIAHLLAEKEAGRLDAPALVVAPTTLVGNWRRELARFAPALRVVVLHGPQRRDQLIRIPRADVVVTTYPVLVRDQAVLATRTFSHLILDEAQAIKNARSLVHKAALAMRARHRLCLSGTPVENTLGELWSLFELLMPGLLGEADWFRHRYVVPIEREGNADRLRALREQVAPFILRRTKEEVARDLPPKTEIVRPVELRGPQRDLYESLRVAAHAEVRQAIRRKGLAASAITILDALMKLRQVCCDPRLLPGETAREVTDSAKHDLLMEMLQQQLAGGRRVLVFSQFASMLGLISASLRREGIRHSALTGATVDRQGAVDAFEQRRADVFLISLKAGGTGLNLTSADTVIHFDPWWNPAAQAQATDRAHRIGQTRAVFVYKLIVAGSVEERMLALQRRKQQLADGLLGRADGARLPTLSEREVDGLFAPLADEDAAG